MPDGPPAPRPNCVGRMCFRIQTFLGQVAGIPQLVAWRGWEATKNGATGRGSPGRRAATVVVRRACASDWGLCCTAWCAGIEHVRMSSELTYGPRGPSPLYGPGSRPGVLPESRASGGAYPQHLLQLLASCTCTRLPFSCLLLDVTTGPLIRGRLIPYYGIRGQGRCQEPGAVPHTRGCTVCVGRSHRWPLLFEAPGWCLVSLTSLVGAHAIAVYPS